jgi:hypothetical protein
MHRIVDDNNISVKKRALVLKQRYDNIKEGLDITDNDDLTRFG